MAERCIRFGIANGNRSRRAATWRRWTNTGGDNSVYLTCRELRGTIHLSLHETGHWHLTFDDKKFDNLFNDQDRPISRIINRLKPHETVPGWVFACCIHTPWYAVTSPITAKKNIIWIDVPVNGYMSEIFVILGAVGTICTGWPGARSMKTSLVGKFELKDRSQVWIVSRNASLVQPQWPDDPNVHAFKGVSNESYKGKSLRAMLFNTSEYGMLTIFECPVIIQQNQN
jgi:hypothetical protein